MKLQTVCFAAVMLLAASSNADDWSQSQIEKLPAGEKPISLFNGKDLDGWVGFKDKYFTV